MFSGGVRLGDLDDFLGPAQDCIAPLLVADGKVQVSSASIPGTTKDEQRVVETAVESVRPNLIKKTGPEDTAQVSLSDCLACSGCVTSAETVLLQEQSIDEFKRRCGYNNSNDEPGNTNNDNANAAVRLRIVSISPESLVSLAHHFKLTPWTCIRRLSFVLQHTYGVDFVCDMSAACAITLWERQRLHDEAQGDEVKRQMASMSSTCPGWTLYAEKVCDPAVLPHINLARSPQHVQGSLIKRIFAPSLVSLSRAFDNSTTQQQRQEEPRSLFSPTVVSSMLLPRTTLCWWDRKRRRRKARPVTESGNRATLPDPPSSSSSSSVYHVLIAPCFDRKIEAVRPQYETAEHGREVDTVLATTEVLELLPPSFGSPQFQEGEVYNAWNLQCLRELPRPKEFWDILGEATTLEWKEIRNDLKEVMHKDDNSSQLVKYVRAYGFKNIQNAIRRVKQKGKVRAIEVMACPSACLNGGGQIATTGDTKERVERLRQLWPTGELPNEALLWKLYKAQPAAWWRTDFRSLKGASIRW